MRGARSDTQSMCVHLCVCDVCVHLCVMCVCLCGVCVCLCMCVHVCGGCECTCGPQRVGESLASDFHPAGKKGNWSP